MPDICRLDDPHTPPHNPKGERGFLFIAGLAILLALLPASVRADSAEEFYRGKRIRFIVGSAGGGGYESYSRTVMRVMARHIPGNPTYVVENMPGGGGLLAPIYLYNVSPRDGLEIGMVERAAALEPLINPDNGNAKFDGRKFNWIGSPQEEIGLTIVREPSPIHSLEDLKTHELILSGTNHTASPSVYPRLLNSLFGTRFKVIEGYKSSNEALLAVERGEVGGHSSGSSSGTWRGQVAPWLAEGKVRIVLQLGLKKDPTLPDVPLVTEFAHSESEREMLDLVFAQQSMAWPILAPPGVPADRVAALRAAFAATMRDPDFLASAQQQKLEIHPVSGSEIDALLARVYATPPEIVKRVTALVGPNG
jgi:tripartite-type tricarboxylate transporter receptor subunit TctC